MLPNLTRYYLWVLEGNYEIIRHIIPRNITRYRSLQLDLICLLIPLFKTWTAFSLVQLTSGQILMTWRHPPTLAETRNRPSSKQGNVSADIRVTEFGRHFFHADGGKLFCKPYTLVVSLHGGSIRITFCC